MKYRIDFHFSGEAVYSVEVYGEVPALFRSKHSELKRVGIVEIHDQPKEETVGWFRVERNPST